jgi:short-subunit dehydrogenase
MVRAASSEMCARKQAAIANLSSMVGSLTSLYVFAYAAGKHAVESSSEVLRFELAPVGVRAMIVDAYCRPSSWNNGHPSAPRLSTSRAFKRGKSKYPKIGT